MPGLKSKATDESSAVDFNIKHVDAVIPVSEWSTNYANAGRYIQDNYDDQAFFTFAEAVFNTFNRQDWQSVGDSLTEADVLSSPCEMFGAGSQAAYSSVIEENRRQAFQQFGIEGTPAVAVNGTLLREASESAIINAIKQ
jgi:protein-disulfide isomerase